MRAYHVAAAADALACPTKWLDNILSRHDIPGVSQSRQGVSRLVPFDALVTLAVVRILTTRFDIPTTRAVALATEITADAYGWSGNPDLCGIRVDLPRLRQEMSERARAAELSVPLRRGRPPLRRPNAD